MLIVCLLVLLVFLACWFGALLAGWRVVANAMAIAVALAMAMAIAVTIANANAVAVAIAVAVAMWSYVHG